MGAVCDLLADLIEQHIRDAKGKIWHGHRVWFLDDKPIVGYSKQKPGIRLMFWSGPDFDEPELNVLGKKFKNALIFYNERDEVDEAALKRWPHKSRDTQGRERH